MKHALIFMTLLAACSPGDAQKTNGQEPARMQKAEPIYDNLRGLALRTKGSDLDLPSGLSAYGVIMDIDIDGNTATLTSFATGDASLYLSTGGGTIGGGAHASVASAAKQFVQLAGQNLAKMTKVEEFPRPGPGRVNFYVLTPGGVYSVSRNENDLGEERDELSPLFYAGHEVITQLRLIPAND